MKRKEKKYVFLVRKIGKDLFGNLKINLGVTHNLDPEIITSSFSGKKGKKFWKVINLWKLCSLNSCCSTGGFKVSNLCLTRPIFLQEVKGLFWSFGIGAEFNSIKMTLQWVNRLQVKPIPPFAKHSNT